MAGAEGFGGEYRRLPPNGYKICNSDLIFEFSMSKNIGIDISHIKIKEFQLNPWQRQQAVAAGSGGGWRRQSVSGGGQSHCKPYFDIRFDLGALKIIDLRHLNL